MRSFPGGCSLFLFLIQIITGAYSPAIPSAGFNVPASFLPEKLPVNVERDVAFRKKICFEVTRNDTDFFDLSSKVTVSQKFLSKRSLNDQVIFLSEPFYAPVKKLDVYYNDKRAKKIPFENIDRPDVFIGNSKVFILNFEGLINLNEEVTYSYKQEYQSIAYLPVIEIPNLNFIEDFTIEIEHPEEVHTGFEFYFPHGDLSYTTEREEEKTILRFTSLSKAPERKFMEFGKTLAFIRIVLTENNKNITPYTAEEFVKWYGKLTNLCPSIEKRYLTETDKIIKKEWTGERKLAFIDSLVRNGVRYIAVEKGINAIVPREPSFVFENRYGDCKDKVFLTAAIARHYGLDVYPALISTETVPDLKGVHLNHFNHVICSYREKGELKFFDPTAKFSHIGFLPDVLLGKRVLILDPDNPACAVIPQGESAPTISIDIDAEESSLASAKGTITFTNSYFSLISGSLHYSDFSQVKLFLSGFMNRMLNNISLRLPDSIDVTGKPDWERESSVTLGINADLSRLPIRTENNIYIPKTIFSVPSSEFLEREQDSLPLFLPSLLKLRVSISVGYHDFDCIRDSMIAGGRNNRYFSAIRNKDNGKMELYYSADISETFIPSAEKTEFMDFCKEYIKNRNQMFVLKRKQK